MYDVTQSTQHDFCWLQQIVHHFCFLRSRLAASPSKLTYRSFLFCWPIRSRPANQLFLVYGDASCSVCQPSPRGPDNRKPFCRGHLLHADEDATLLSVLRVALGDNHDNKSLNSTLRILTPETWQRRRRPAPCLFLPHRRTRSSGAWAEEARGSGLELVTLGHRPTHTRGPDDFGNDILQAVTCRSAYLVRLKIRLPELLFQALF